MMNNPASFEIPFFVIIRLTPVLTTEFRTTFAQVGSQREFDGLRQPKAAPVS
jgi:hypothetical protein